MEEREWTLPHSWHGSGAPLVLIAGLGGKGTSWRPFLELAATRYRVLTFDNPGSGETPPLRGPLSIREMAAAVLRLLDELALDSVPIVGRSMGGMIAQELALLAPERIQRLVLVSTTARVDPHLEQVFRLWAAMAEAGVRSDVRHRSSLLWCLGSRSLAERASVRSYLAARASSDRPRDYSFQARACAEHDALDRLVGLRLPTLVVSGSDDRLTPEHHARGLCDAIPGAEYARIPGAGHLPYLEDPGPFAEAVLGFLGGEARA